MSKFNKLWEYINNSKQEAIKLSFEDIKDVLGFDIDHSFLTYKKELKNYGYEVQKISLKEKTVLFNRIK
jgi:hypothetical protein